MADPFASIDTAIASTPPPSAKPEPVADPFAAVDEGLKGNAQKSNLTPQVNAEPSPMPEPTKPEETAPTQPTFNPPATLPVPASPGVKPFQPLTDISKPELMARPVMKGYDAYMGNGMFGPIGQGTAPQFGEGIRPAPVYDKAGKQINEGEVPLYQNAMKDLGDLGEGINRMMNASLLRGINMLPEEVAGIGIPNGQGRLLFGEVGKKGWQDPDLSTLGAIAKGTADYYNDRYIQPFNPMNGGGLNQGGEALRQQWSAHPLSVLDIAGGGMMNAAEGGLSLGNAAFKAMKRPVKPTGYIMNGQVFHPVQNAPAQIQALKSFGANPSPINYTLTGSVQKMSNDVAQIMEDIYAGINKIPETPRWLKKNKSARALIGAPGKIKDYASKILLQSPLQAPWQMLQNSIVFSLTHINSPQDLMYAGIGMMMASGKMRRWIPEEFFTGGTVPPQTLAQMPKWLTFLAMPDKLMDKHLELIGKQDNYWRAAAAMTMAVRETMNVSSPQAFKQLAGMLQLSYSAQKNINKLFKDPQMAQKFLKEVHRTMGNYEKEFGTIEHALNKNVMFYRAIRHLFILSSSFPFHHPVKTSAIHALSTVMVKLAESEPMNARIKAAGGVLVRDKEGNLVLGPNGMPMVFTKAGGLTPFIGGIQDIQFIAKMLNREGMGDVDSIGSVAPFVEILFGAAGYDLGRGMAPYKDPDSVSPDMGKTQVKREKVERAMEGDYELQDGDYQLHPARPWEALLGDSLVPQIYNSILKYQAQVQEIPGVPSDFSTIDWSGKGEEKAPRRTPTGEKIKPTPITPGSWFFSKLQPSEMMMDQEMEQGFNKYRGDKAKQKYIRSSMDRED